MPIYRRYPTKSRYKYRLGNRFRYNYGYGWGSRYRRWAYILGAVILIVGAVMGVQKAIYVTTYSSRSFEAAVAEPINSLDPAVLPSQSAQLVASAVYEGLAVYNESSGEVRPTLAKEWEYGDDGQSLTIKLRPDIKFSNGQLLTATIVKTSWERQLMSTEDWANISLFFRIAGAQDFQGNRAKEISGLQVLDDHTLKITFVRPDAAFVHALTNPIFWVTLVTDNKALVGTGPFVVKEQTPDRIVLLRNENYHGTKPNLTAINVTRYKDENEALTAYLAGKADYLDKLPMEKLPTIAQDVKYKHLLLQKPLMEVYWLGFNQNREPYANNYLLRRALNYAVDRESIVKNTLGGGYLAVKGVIPAGNSAYNEQMGGYFYDPAKAQQLLTQAGFPNGEGLRPLTLTYNRDPGHRQVALEVARQLATLGIRVQVQEQDWDYYTKQLSGLQLSFFRLGWKADYADADNLLYTIFHSNLAEGSNLTGYHNPQVDKALDESRAQYKDNDARIKLLKRAEEMIVDDAPCLWLFQRKSTVLMSPDVRDLEIDSLGKVDWIKVGLGS